MFEVLWRLLTRWDKLLVGLILVVIISTLSAPGPDRQPGPLQVDTAQGRQPSLDLQHDQELVLEGPLGNTRIRVRGGRAEIIASACTNKICLFFGRLERPGEMAVCLPNRVSIRVGSASSARLDGVTR